MNDLLCIASSCVDMIFAGMRKFPEPGTEEFAEEFIIKGGGGANTPVAAAKLGLKTAFITQLGEDSLGNIMYKFFEDSGMVLDGIIRSKEKTTSVTAVLSMNHERGFASYDKNNLSDVDLSLLEDNIKNSRHVHTHIAYCKHLPIIGLAKKYNCSISLDTSWSAEQRLIHYADILKRIDIFMPNEEEACTLADTKDSISAANILSQYVKILVIKLGSKGSLIVKDGKIMKIEPIKNIKLIDTTGAGDLFNAGFLYGFLKGYDLEKCGRIANASGALSVTFLGGMDDAYTHDAVKKMYSHEKIG